MSNSSSSSITALVPGGVVTTQNISTVIKPKENNNSMQFVKIQTPELSKKAVEQIRVAQESKITKDKIKEVEEEWQSNLLNWKSKRRQQFVGVHPPKNDQDQEEQNNNDANNENGRKIKTFAEMIEQRAKAGNRLNFHLERYIGSSESDSHEDEKEDDDAADGENYDHKQLSNNINSNNNNVNNDAINDNDHLRGTDVVDRTNSLSINNNISIETVPISKEKPFLPDASDQSVSITTNSHPLFENNCGAGDTSNEVKFKLHDHQLVSEQHDYFGGDDDDDYAERRPINSTFIKGVEQPPTLTTNHSDVAINPILDASPIVRDVGSVNARKPDRRDYEEDDEHEEEEEEDEEEEEQKQLQRIAFVAKLKAFEKLIQPPAQEPRFVPTRTAKAPPPPPPALARSSPSSSLSRLSDTPPQPRTPTAVAQQPKPRPIPQPQAKAAPAPVPPPHPIQRVVEPKELPSPKPPLSSPGPSTNPQPPPPPRAKPRTPSPPSPKLQPNETFKPQPPLPPSPSTQHQKSKLAPSPIVAPAESALTPSPVTARKQPAIPQPSSRIPPQITSLASPPQPLTDNQLSLSPAISPRLSSPQVAPSLPASASDQLPSPLRTPQKPPQALRHQTSVTPRQQSQPQPQSPPHSGKEDKSQDRTVLSVSGKKRCSSCKEELGRGAAAFVIESLNLVYHTNCFRCSVCHVNLSNGFRGVDVRVHAGALHCQNCYSKDGLNYSRV